MKRDGLWSVTDGSREGKVKRGGLWLVTERRKRHEKGWFVVSDREKEKT